MENTAELGPSASFPVTFFDGDLEFDIGHILVHPSLEFNIFISLISQKIGIYPHQISTSLVRHKNAKNSPEICRKVPIDSSSDFALIAKQRDCYILAILKRSRKTRFRRHGQRGKAVASKTEVIVPEKTILKRFSANGLAKNYESQLEDMLRQRERYLMLTEMAYRPLEAAVVAGEATEDSSKLFAMEATSTEIATAAAKRVVCEECVSSNDGRSDDFHLCVYDAVTVGFRSMVGPIQRPSHKDIRG